MQSMDRRGFLRGLAGAATVAAVAAGTTVTLLTDTAGAAPVPADKTLRQAMEDFAEPVQYRRRHHHHWHNPHWRRRRRRHWRCWWHRGRRVCGWRYW